jgi:alpha-tubulin suppressor-like RCC1 family protein
MGKSESLVTTITVNEHISKKRISQIAIGREHNMLLCRDSNTIYAFGQNNSNEVSSIK